MIDVGSTKFQFNQTNLAGMLLGFVQENQYVTVQTLDGNNTPYQPDYVDVRMFDQSGAEVIINGAEYDIDNLVWKTEICPTNIGSYLLRWKSSDNEVGTQLYIVIDGKMQHWMYSLKNLIDKSMKDNTKTWSYTDSDLFMYIVNGLNYFNTLMPISSFNLGGVPFYLEGLMIDLASLFAIQAQMMYSIDTDVNYSDQGMSLNIDHFSKLNTAYELVANRVIDNAKKIKWTMGARPVVLAQFNPERSRSFVFNQFIANGFPYFSFNFGTSLVGR